MKEEDEDEDNGVAEKANTNTNTATTAATRVIVPKAEAVIMTRSLIKFETMQLLVRLPASTTIAQVTLNMIIFNRLF